MNAVGIAVFLTLASRSWIEQELAEFPGANAGAAFGWAGTALPVLVLFALAHFAAGAVALKPPAGHRRSSDLLLVGLTMACWFGAALFDNAHHGL